MPPFEREDYQAKLDQQYRISKMTPEEREVHAREQYEKTIEGMTDEERLRYDAVLRSGREEREQGWRRMKENRRRRREEAEEDQLGEKQREKWVEEAGSKVEDNIRTREFSPWSSRSRLGDQ